MFWCDFSVFLVKGDIYLVISLEGSEKNIFFAFFHHNIFFKCIWQLKSWGYSRFEEKQLFVPQSNVMETNASGGAVRP